MNWKDLFPKEHRYFETENGILYCGDCLEIMKDFPNHIIDLIVTDPPYRTSYNGYGILEQKIGYMKNKVQEISNFEPKPFLEQAKRVMKKINMYIYTSKNLLLDYLTWINENKLNFDILVYGKTNPLPSHNNSYLSDIEFVIFTRERGAIFNNGLGYDMYRKLMIDKINATGIGHPTVKPLWQIEKFVKISSKEQDLILDPFAGSGTTALACERLNRKWIAIEIDRGYCDIIVSRISGIRKYRKDVNLFSFAKDKK